MEDKVEYTKSEYVKIFRELWEWLSLNPEKEKHSWPRWKSNGGDISDCINHCPLCSWIFQEYKNTQPSTCETYCPIKWSGENTSCTGSPSLFLLWCATKVSAERENLAKQISELPVRK